MYIDVDLDSPGGTGGHMYVDPDKLVQLKKGIEDEADRVRRWLNANSRDLFKTDPPGHDPCSRDTMSVMGQNGQTAIEKADAYLARLTTLAEKLHESAVAYGVTEDHTAATFRQEMR